MVNCHYSKTSEQNYIFTLLFVTFESSEALLGTTDSSEFDGLWIVLICDGSDKTERAWFDIFMCSFSKHGFGNSEGSALGAVSKMDTGFDDGGSFECHGRISWLFGLKI